MEKPPQPETTGLARLGSPLRYSVDGLQATYQYEAAFRQEVIVAAVLIPLALWLSVSVSSKLLMIASVVLVLIVELLNSAIEAAVDRISPETHELAKRAKDAGSAAVRVAIANAVVVWLLVLLG